jgi:hypothetical protein
MGNGGDYECRSHRDVCDHVEQWRVSATLPNKSFGPPDSIPFIVVLLRLGWMLLAGDREALAATLRSGKVRLKGGE